MNDIEKIKAQNIEAAASTITTDDYARNDEADYTAPVCRKLSKDKDKTLDNSGGVYWVEEALRQVRLSEQLLAKAIEKALPVGCRVVYSCAGRGKTTAGTVSKCLPGGVEVTNAMSGNRSFVAAKRILRRLEWNQY